MHAHKIFLTNIKLTGNNVTVFRAKLTVIKVCLHQVGNTIPL